MLVLDRFMRQSDGDLIVSTTVSPRSEPALRVFEWSRAPIGTWDKSAFWITNYRGFAKIALGLKSVPFAEVVSYPVSAALLCRDKFKVLEGQINGSNSEIELCPGFDSRFDDFWEELKRQNNNLLLASRNRETLALHFSDSQIVQTVGI